MSRIQVTININDDLIKEESQQEVLEDAISQELGWLKDSGMFIEGWSFATDEPEHNKSVPSTCKQAVILTCVHEHAYGASLYSSIHPDNHSAVSHAEVVKATCDFEEDKGEFFNFDIHPVTIDVSLLQDAIAPDRHSPLDTQIQAAESRTVRPSAGEGRGVDRSLI